MSDSANTLGKDHRPVGTPTGHWGGTESPPRGDRGFTLNELMITVALLGVMVMVVGGFFDNVMRAFGFGRELASYETEARHAVDVMTREVRAAHSPDLDAADMGDRWPIVQLDAVSVTFYALDRGDLTGQTLKAVQYALDPNTGILKRGVAPMELVAGSTDKWQQPAGGLQFEYTDLARNVVNSASKPLFRDPDGPAPGEECASTALPGLGIFYQAIDICLAVDRNPSSGPAAMVLRSAASWRNPSTNDQGGQTPGANGDLFLAIQKTGVQATNGSQTWAAPSGCNYYSNGCVRVGDRLTYEIEYGNSGASDVTEATVTDPLDPQVDFDSCTASCSYDAANRRVVWNVTFNGGTSDRVRVTVLVSSSAVGGANVYNDATLNVTKYRAGGSILTGNVTVQSTPQTSHRVSIPLPNLAITKTGAPAHNANVDRGASGSYTVTVSNTGAGVGPAHNVVVSDTLSSALDYLSATQGTYNSSTRVWSWSMPEIAAGQSVTATINVRVKQNSTSAKGCSQITNTAGVTSDEQTKTSGQVKWNIKPCPGFSKVGVSPSGSGPLGSGATAQFKFTLSNANTSLGLTNAYIEDTVDNSKWNTPGTCTPIRSGVTCSYNSTSRKWTITIGAFPVSPSAVDVASLSLTLKSGAQCSASNQGRLKSDYTNDRTSTKTYNVSYCPTTTTTSGGGGSSSSTTTSSTSTTTTTTSTTTTTRPGGV